MFVPPLIPQKAQRDRFLATVARAGCVFGVVGEQGLARVPSRRLRDREVSLFWSDAAIAGRLAPEIAMRPRVRTYPLGELLNSVLPGLALHRRLIGLDWTGAELEVELDPNDFAERLRLASLDAFVAAVQASGSVFTLEGAVGPGLMVSQTRPDVLVLPCWADPGEAHARLEGPWREMLVIETPVSAFLNERLAWLKQFGHLVRPDDKGGPGALEMQPDDLIVRFARRAA